MAASIFAPGRPLISAFRWSRRLCTIVMLCASPLLASSASAKNVALLIAVGRFGDPVLDQNNQLLGTVADIAEMQKALSQRWGFAPADIKVIRDKDATHDAVLAEISGLEQRSAPGDTVLLYFSGHGTSANDEDNQYDLPYATGAWIPYDFDQTNVASEKRTLIVGRRDLVPRLKALDAGGRWVVVVSDSCFSGQVVRRIGQTHSHTRFLPLRGRDLGVSAAHAAAPAAAPTVPSARPLPPPYPYQHVVLLSGASDSEAGGDISSAVDLQRWPTFDHQFHGAFTDAFLRLLNGQLLPGSFTYAQARDKMSSFLEGRSLPQHPQLLPALAEDPQDIGSNQFLAAAHAAATPAASAPPAAAGTRDTTVHVRLDGVAAPLKAAIAALPGVAVVDQGGELSVHQNGQQLQLLGPAGDPILSTVSGDAKLVQRIAAQAWLNKALPAGSDKLGLRAETDPGSRGNTFVQCENFVFEVRLLKPGYLMLLDLDPQGGLTLLYPTRPSERKIVASGAAKAIPGADPKDHILVTAPFGSDQVTVLAFEQPQPFLDDLNGAERFLVNSGRADALARGLAHANGAVSVQQVNVNTYAGSGKDTCGQ